MSSILCIVSFKYNSFHKALELRDGNITNKKIYSYFFIDFCRFILLEIFRDFFTRTVLFVKKYDTILTNSKEINPFYHFSVKNLSHLFGVLRFTGNM